MSDGLSRSVGGKGVQMGGGAFQTLKLGSLVQQEGPSQNMSDGLSKADGINTNGVRCLAHELEQVVGEKLGFA